MNIKLVVIGKLKEKYLRDGCDEYIKRLSKFCNLKIVELDEYKLPDKPSQKDIDNALIIESKNILKHCEGYIISMCIEGNQVSSEDLAKKFETVTLNGYGTITFIIGSSFGLDSSVKNKSDFKLSMSKMTFTHQIARMLLLEQIYRAFQINTNGKYHK
ncbi:MAG: 23S rRNA (pseudouridine(1915)-N(3))-methyltransferase RlmH [Ruminococcus sp.]|nr:23S rRNA (pseudouridine(1915)-N(3))-methyltransferase RlmH [Ruminococcus sp.]